MTFTGYISTYRSNILLNILILYLHGLNLGLSSHNNYTIILKHTCASNW